MKPHDPEGAPQPVPPPEAVPRSTCEGVATSPDNNVPLPVFTLLTSDADFLTKSISLVDGKLHKVACAQPRTATAQTRVVADLPEFGKFLDSLDPTQAVLFGVMVGRTEARVVTEAKRHKHRNAISRTRQFFQFAPQPGVMMFDHDGMEGGRAIAPQELYERLIAAVPALAGVQILWRPSASSGIVGPDGAPLTEVIGQRFYVFVQDASLIPDAGKAIWDLLWAAREGWVVIGKAGQKLQRSLVDKSVWQPERLDFAAPPVVQAPLTRSPVPWRVFGQGADRLDLRKVIVLADGSVKRKARQHRHAALQAATGESEEVRQEWVKQEAPKLAKARSISEEDAREVLAHASSTQVLLGNFELLAEDGTRVTVAELLADPDRWHGTRFADPLEPDYHDDDRVAWANLKSGGPPYIFSHAHGSCRYMLARELRTIVVREGERTRIVDECLEAMRAAGEVFELGHSHALVRVVRGRVVPVTATWLLDHLQRCSRFEKQWVTPQGLPMTKATDLKDEIALAILAKGGERKLPRLSAVVTAPTLRADGSLLDENGHDVASGLLLLRDEPDAPVPIPPHPTPEDALAALSELWGPFRLFPFVGPVDRGTYLAALLTACIRASLPAAPGFALDAPAAGTGKTLLGRCIGALATGESPPILPPVSNRNDDEVRKRLFAVVREGAPIVLWDNVREPLGNQAIDAFLTASTYSDRVLGVSETLTLPNRALFVVTGNNLRFEGDTCRRILRARLDAKLERPYARAFDFCPLQWTLANRQRMVACAVTILRARIVAGRPRPADGSVASFEEWDELVRQAVVWIADIAQRHPDVDVPIFDDPIKGVDASFALDSETGKLKALLVAWHALVADKRVTVNDLMTPSHERPDGTAVDLLDAMMEIAGERGHVNPRILGRWLERNVDRPVAGLCLRRGLPRGGRVTWRVVEAGEVDAVDDGGEPDHPEPSAKEWF